MNILPTPRLLLSQAGELSLAHITITLSPGLDVRLMTAALTLQQEIAEKGTCRPVVKIGQAVCGGIHITAKEGTGEGYEITVTPGGAVLAGEGAAGAFYAIQTLRQMVRTAEGGVLPCCRIQDAPSYETRGFYHDVTRGRVPKLDCLKQLCDTLCYYKINMLQLYIEDAFAFEELSGIMSCEEVLTAAEIRELDDYCHERFIELVPSVSTFGHLYRLLQSKRYAHLCEFENYQPTQHPWIEKMQHHTIDPFQPESLTLVCSMIDQVIGLCRSESFNICCDETFDLCRGRNAGKDPGNAYFDFVAAIIHHVKDRGKRVMMWGDIALHHPEKLQKLPKDTILLNWNYAANPDNGAAKVFERSGLSQYVCPGTTSWNRFVEDITVSGSNICGMAAIGQQHGAIGLLNTNWGDFGNVCTLNGALYGLVLGAHMSWNPAAAAGEEYEQAFSRLAYGQQDVNMADLLRKLNTCENTAPWGELIHFLSARDYEGVLRPLQVNEAACKTSIADCNALLTQLSALPQTVPVEDLCQAARMIRLMNQIFLHTGGFDVSPDFREEFARYRVQWLRDSKPSGLDGIEEVFECICR